MLEYLITFIIIISLDMQYYINNNRQHNKNIQFLVLLYGSIIGEEIRNGNIIIMYYIYRCCIAMLNRDKLDIIESTLSCVSIIMSEYLSVSIRVLNLMLVGNYTHLCTAELINVISLLIVVCPVNPDIYLAILCLIKIITIEINMPREGDRFKI
jgi:hypothetical protein